MCLSAQGVKPFDGVAQALPISMRLPTQPSEHHDSCVQHTIDGVWAMLLGHLQADVVADLHRLQVGGEVRLCHSFIPTTVPQEQRDIVLMMTMCFWCHHGAGPVKLYHASAPGLKLIQLWLKRMHLCHLRLGCKQAIASLHVAWRLILWQSLG